MMRGPKRSMNAPAKGPKTPCSRARMEKPAATAAVVQPVSSRIGSMKTPKLQIAMPETRKFEVAPEPTMYQPK
ncbi:MAG: hypothetical protein F4X80_06400 [Chloroflexi bacterium]|nr:hypothetical protein [Chloroflexota bacterium]